MCYKLVSGEVGQRTRCGFTRAAALQTPFGLKTGLELRVFKPPGGGAGLIQDSKWKSRARRAERHLAGLYRRPGKSECQGSGARREERRPPVPGWTGIEGPCPLFLRESYSG